MKFTLTEGEPVGAGALDESLDPETATAYAFNGSVSGYGAILDRKVNDPQEEYRNQIMKRQQEQYKAKCPSCGYCPTCGRGGSYFPPTQPWPPFHPNPTYPGVGVQPWITYCGAH